MGMKYYAKSKKKGLSDKERGKQIKEPEEEQKTLNSHQEDIVRCAEAFFEEYGRYFSEKEKRLVIEACRIHDWGKANLVFQAMINPELAGERKLNVKSISQIPHGHLSAVTLSQNEFFAMDDSFTKDDFGAFVTAVYHHHTRKDQEDSSELRTYGKKYYLEEISDYLGQTRTKLYCSNLNHLLFHNNGYSGKFLCDPAVWNEYLLIKGLLNKFDYTVSAGYESAELACDIREKRLKKEVESFLEGKDLRSAQQFMKEHTDDNLVVIAPTGSGKTEAALLWLDGEKGFYTLPLKVSSNAIYSRIKSGYGYEHAAILHSDSMAMYLKENPGSAWEKQEQAKLLANPVTVCTIDQLFTFVYRALGTEIFAATLKYSKLIIDEIQSYDPRSIATILYGLKTIQQMGGRYAIITATFPPVLKDFMEQYGLADHCLFADFTEDPDILIRHKVSIRYSEMYLEEIAKQGKTKKVLVIPFPGRRRFMKNCGKGTILCGCYIPVLFAETVIYWNKRLWSFQNRMKRGSGSPRRSLKPVWISILIFCTRKCVQQTACCSVWEDVTGREEGFLNFPIFLYMITKMEAEVFTRRTCISDRWKN